MKMNRRTFTKYLALAAGALALPSWPVKAFAARLPVNRVTKIRCYYGRTTGLDSAFRWMRNS